MSTRTAGSIVVLLLVVGSWWLWGGDADAVASGRSDPVVVERPDAGVGAGAGAPPHLVSGVAAPDPEAEKTASPSRDEVPLKATAEQPRGVGDVLDRAHQLVSAGQGQAAEGLLRKEMAAANGAAQARLGLFLAPLTADPVERRRLLTRALRLGAVLGAEWDDVGRHLRALNRDPRASLHGLVPWDSYTVQPNDSLWKLVNRTFPERYGVTLETGVLQLFNGMGSTNLHVGQTLLVPKAELAIHVDREDHGLALYMGDVALVAYRVGLGKEGRTPRGEFVVEVKQTEPTWYRAGRAIPYGHPENILGTRWMGFENTPGVMGYGIHGTDKPASIGLDESMGCVRMRNEDVEELFELTPRGTRVFIP